MRASTSTNITVFALFFGISLLDAFASGNLWRAAFWLAIGAVFVMAGRVRRTRKDRVAR